MLEVNWEKIGNNDILLATFPGSGASWLSNVLVSLNLFYAAGEEEILFDDVQQKIACRFDAPLKYIPIVNHVKEDIRPQFDLLQRMKHLPILEQRHLGIKTFAEPLRIIKTNSTTQGRPINNKVILLVRDGRDTVLSSYHWFKNFTNLQHTFEEYMTGRIDNTPIPAACWAFFYMSWLNVVSENSLHIMRFEDCKQHPQEEINSLLRFLEIERNNNEIEHAIAVSTFTNMKKLEQKAITENNGSIGSGTMMRSGKIGEWRIVYTDTLRECFNGFPIRALKHFGYSLQ